MKFWLEMRDRHAFKRYVVKTAAKTDVKRLGKLAIPPPSIDKALAYADFAHVLARTGRHAAACRFAQRAVDLSVSLREIRAEALAHLAFGAALLAACRYDESREQSNIALAMFENGGDTSSTYLARCLLAECSMWLGHAANAAAEASDVYWAAGGDGEIGIAALALALWATASGGDVSEAALAVELERSKGERLLDDGRVWRAEGICRLKQHLFPGAIAALEKSVQAAACLQDFPDEPLSSRLWLVTAKRTLFEDKKNLADGRLPSECRTTVRMARRALHSTKRFRHYRPHAFRELALLAALCERESEARRAIDASMQTAKELSLCREYALSLEARGRIGVRFDWPECDDDLGDGRYFAGKLQAVATRPQDYKRSVDQLRATRP